MWGHVARLHSDAFYIRQIKKSRICYALDRRFKIMNPCSWQLAAKVQILSDISLKSSLKLFVSSWISSSCTRTFSSLESVAAIETSAATRTCALFVSVRASFMLCLGQVIASFFPLCLLVNKAKWNRFNKVFLRKAMSYGKAKVIFSSQDDRQTEKWNESYRLSQMR